MERAGPVIFTVIGIRTNSGPSLKQGIERIDIARQGVGIQIPECRIEVERLIKVGEGLVANRFGTQ